MKRRSGRLKVLFVCQLNMMRSPTAEEIFKRDPRLEVKSAGVSRSAVVHVNDELLQWADVVFVMEKEQKNEIKHKYRESSNLNIICLDISDSYDFMDPVLVRLLIKKVEPLISDLIS